MFSYYGSKSRIVHLYPKPQFDTIVEPFAGSARYSLLHGKSRRVILIENNPVLIKLWRWLKTVKISTLEKLPVDLPSKSFIPTNLKEEARILLGFMLNRGSPTPKNYVGWPISGWQLFLQRLPLIRHYEIVEGDYSMADKLGLGKVTWFIDPPYISQTGYPTGRNLDYAKLASWIRRRRGQVIVCENSTATWLPFKPFIVQTNTQRKNSPLRHEGIYLQ